VIPSIIQTVATISTAVSILSPIISGAILVSESIWGHSSVTGKPEGEQKRETAVHLLLVVLQALAEAGHVPPTAVKDPAVTAGVAGAVQQEVERMKSQGLLAAPVAPTKP
jgi:hypothetical protein